MVASTKNIVKSMMKGHLVLKKREEERRAAGASSSTLIQGQFYMPGMPYPGMEKKKKIHEKKGIDITTDLTLSNRLLGMESEDEELRTVNISYCLIPQKPRRREELFSYANIRWEPKISEVVYHVIEPSLTEADKEIIKRVKSDLEERLNVDFTKLGEVKAKELLMEEIEKSFARMPDVIIEQQKKRVLVFYIEKDLVGLGKIEALMKDPNIEDISCDGFNIPVYVYHRNPKLGSLRTNVVFTDKDELDSFAVKLAQKSNKGLSIAEPLLDGSLPDGSRVQATLGTDIARKGSNFTIRKFTEEPLTPTHMLQYKTLNSLQLAYLWMAIEYGQSMLISGGTATGKSSMLNVLSLFIRPNMKVVSIEDTAELRLPLPHWVPHVARTPISVEGRIGEVSLFDLLKTSLRQRPDYIIVGEVRGKETYVLFQQIATGHTGLATIHAANFSQLMDRLITPPISLPPSLLENIGIIVFLVVSKKHGSHIRRANTVVEVTGMKDNKPLIRTVFKWDPMDDTFKINAKSVVLNTIAERMGVEEDKIKQEIARRKAVLEWMLKKKIFDYREVARVISTYYTNPEKLLDLITSE